MKTRRSSVLLNGKPCNVCFVPFQELTLVEVVGDSPIEGVRVEVVAVVVELAELASGEPKSLAERGA